jgi:hypothetical protein
VSWLQPSDLAMNLLDRLHCASSAPIQMEHKCQCLRNKKKVDISNFLQTILELTRPLDMLIAQLENVYG